MTWIKTKGIQSIPDGDWLVILKDGSKGYLENSTSGSGGKFGIINGKFYFDLPEVIAYTKFPKYEEGNLNVE